MPPIPWQDEFVIMPIHVHVIICIENNWARQRCAPAGASTETTEKFGNPVKGSFFTIVRAYKPAVTCLVNALEKQRGVVLWQKNY